jgi:hypothetical protein
LRLASVCTGNEANQNRSNAKVCIQNLLALPFMQCTAQK